MNIEAQKETVAKATKTVVNKTVSAGNKAVEYSTETASELAEKAKELLARARDAASAGIERLNAVQLGDKNVGEHVETTVETVTSAVDMDQLTEQVAKLRDQIDTMLSSWKDSFRPTADAVKEDVKPAAAPTDAANAPATKTTAKPAAKKPAAKKPAAKKPAVKKPAAKTTAKSTSATKSTAKTAAPDKN